MKTIKYFLAIAILVSVTSCVDRMNENLKPAASGSPGDVVVVMSENHWASAAGDTLLNTLTEPVEALPSLEPMFNVIHVTQSNFGPSFKSQRNIIVTEIGRKYENARILVQKEPWAKKQLVITIQAPSNIDFANLIDTSRNKLVSLINSYEDTRLAETYSKSPDAETEKILRNRMNVALSVPSAYKLDVNEDNFFWLSQEYRDIIQGILLYSYDYTSEDQLTTKSLIDKRNEVLKKYVPGEIPGSYMITEKLLPPSHYTYESDGVYTAEIRGLWKMENGLAMGGPFVSFTRIDQKNKKIVTAEGFVYAPAHKKREYLRQVEAIASSLRFVEK